MSVSRNKGNTRYLGWGIAVGAACFALTLLLQWQSGPESKTSLMIGEKSAQAATTEESVSSIPEQMVLDWSVQLSDSGIDAAVSVTTDATGCVFVAGEVSTVDPVTNTVGCVVKFDASGQIAWQANDLGVADGDVTTLELSESGNLVVAGKVQVEESWDGFVAILDSSDGAVLHVQQLSGNSEDSIEALATFADKVYITGHTQSIDFPGLPEGLSAISFEHAYVSCLNLGDLTVNWTTLVGEEPGAGYAIVYDGQEGIFIGGYSGADALIAKLSDIGELIWERVIGGAGIDIAQAMTMGTDGQLYVGGETESPDFIASMTRAQGGMDGWVASISEDGQVSWSLLVGGADDDGVYALDANDNELIIGGYKTVDGATNTQGMLVRFSTAAFVMSDISSNLTSLKAVQDVQGINGDVYLVGNGATESTTTVSARSLDAVSVETGPRAMRLKSDESIAPFLDTQLLTFDDYKAEYGRLIAIGRFIEARSLVTSVLCRSEELSKTDLELVQSAAVYALFEMKQYELFKDECLRYATDYPESEYIQLLSFMEAQIPYRENDIPGAIASLTAFIEKNPDYGEIATAHELLAISKCSLASSQMDAEDFSSAFQIYNEILQNTPNYGDIIGVKYNRLRCLQALNNAEVFRIDYEAFVNEYANTGADDYLMNAALMRACVAEYEKDWLKAIETLDEIESLYGSLADMAQIGYLRGQAYYALGQYALANQQFEVVLQQYPESVYFVSAAMLAMRANVQLMDEAAISGVYEICLDREDAIELTEQLDLVRLDTEYVLADSLIEAGNYDTALSLLTSMIHRIASQEMQLSVDYRILDCYMGQGDYESFLHSYASFIQNYETMPGATDHLLNASLMRLQVAELQEDWSQLLVLVNEFESQYPGKCNSAQMAYLKGCAWLGMKVHGSAAPYFDAVVTDYPDSEYYKGAAFNGMQAHAGLGEREAVEAIYSDFMSKYPNDDYAPHLKLVRTMCAFNQSDWEFVAVQCIEMLAAQGDELDRAAILYFLGVSQFELEDYDNADVSLSEVTGTYSDSPYAIEADMRRVEIPYRQGNYAFFETNLENFKQQHSDLSESQLTHLDYLTTRIPKMNEDWVLLQERLLAFMANHPSAPHKESVKAEYVMTYYSLKQLPEMLTAIDRLALEYPDHPELPALKFHAMACAYDQSNWDTAISQGHGLLNQYPELECALDAKMVMGMAMNKYGEERLTLLYLQNAEIGAEAELFEEERVAGVGLINGGRELLKQYIEDTADESPRVKENHDTVKALHRVQVLHELGRNDEMYEEIETHIAKRPQIENHTDAEAWLWLGLARGQAMRGNAKRLDVTAKSTEPEITVEDIDAIYQKVYDAKFDDPYKDTEKNLKVRAESWAAEENIRGQRDARAVEHLKVVRDKIPDGPARTKVLTDYGDLLDTTERIVSVEGE